MSPPVRKTLVRLGAMWGVLLIAAVVGLATWSATHSLGALVAIMGVGFAVSVVLRFKLWR
jgi:hypothetical protein